ncbi:MULTISPECIES: hypothetical protein [Staphylococcus]|uniref:hypothetical protein n=1 Tax=Staphylococcus TaxID=1279 RepID=UPI001E4458E0|nr:MULTISPECIES: hypothetical protein [Staphylococcus]MCE3020981.1 hypothetical protein [Staphylococcus pasteuri]MCJ1786311.1 hypothetical protein [Staphylococcus warneri]MCJ1788754.1 hypothetical protein [Staphylococcus warneri]MCJ1791182.1 hypothetical protein [Staphylococcus warneri]MCJ1793641.1 hypothetical protein [Staphylococcus warneri]
MMYVPVIILSTIFILYIIISTILIKQLQNQVDEYYKKTEKLMLDKFELTTILANLKKEREE